MRRRLLVELLAPLEAAELVALVAALVDRVREGRAAARGVMQELALEPSALRELPYARVQEAYARARREGRPDVARLFLGARPPPEDVDDLEGNEHLDLPLGVRRAAARSRDRFALDRLLHDRDPRVIRLLLDNPLIVERDVVRIAAMRPTRPDVLAEVARHRRWAGRYRVRKALAANPFTDARVVRRLLPTLLRQDLRQILQAGLLEPELAAEARELLGGGRGRAADPRVGDDADLARLVADFEERVGAGLAEAARDVPLEQGAGPATVETTPEEDAMLSALVEVMEATLEGREGALELVRVDEEAEVAACLLPPQRS